MIGIIDIGTGNTLSVLKVLRHFQVEHEVVKGASNLMAYEKLIFPGVGSYGHVVNKLHSVGLFNLIQQFLASGKPYLGICLGMQLLSTFGEEGEISEGLNFIKGSVKLLPVDQKEKLPHIGWNNVPHSGTGLFEGVDPQADFYFVHSYCFEVEDEIEQIKTDYSHQFTSYLRKRNVHGVQFHPEKSQKNGLLLIKNFIEKC